MNAKLKTILNVTWKVGLGLFGLVAAVLGILIANVWYEKTRGRDYYNDKTLSTDIVVESYNNNRMRVKNKKTGKYTTPKVMWVSGAPERDSLTVFCDKNGLRGYINVNTGEIVIPAQYSKAWQFSEGLGAVLGEGDRIGFINKENKLVIGYEIPFDKGFDYIFKDGYCVVKFWEDGHYRCAVYSKDGPRVLDWDYTRIDDANSDGYRVVTNEDGAWLYDRSFNKVFEDAYDDIVIAEGNEGVYVTKDYVKKLVDYDGKVLEPFVIDGTYNLKYMTPYHSEGEDDFALVPEVVVYQVNSWEGLMDARTGKILTPAKYWRFEMISEDLISAQLGYSDEEVVLNKQGEDIKAIE